MGNEIKYDQWSWPKYEIRSHGSPVLTHKIAMTFGHLSMGTQKGSGARQETMIEASVWDKHFITCKLQFVCPKQLNDRDWCQFDWIQPRSNYF